MKTERRGFGTHKQAPYSESSLSVQQNSESLGRQLLTLNHEEISDIGDVKLLMEKLKTIFQEREKQSIGERDIVIETEGKVFQSRINRLIESLAEESKITALCGFVEKKYLILRPKQWSIVKLTTKSY